MRHYYQGAKQTAVVSTFEELMSAPFHKLVNAICWKRELSGNFAEIVNKIKSEETIAELDEEQLLKLNLSEEGKRARKILINDLQLLREHGAAPVLNLIKHYERDDSGSIFTTDVYSFHVDRSPVPTSTILCTYYGAPSEILPNTDGIQKIRIPEIREKLKKQFEGTEEDFEDFLIENFYDLHYETKRGARAISLGNGHLWRLAVDHPGNSVLPCLHRAPEENPGEPRLLLIC